MGRIIGSFVLSCALAVASAAYAQIVVLKSPPITKANEVYVKPFDPLRLVGNVYYVGTYDLAVYLIVTPAGNILINTGVNDSAGQIIASVEKLGFKFSDIKLLLATHGHWDHVGAMGEIKRLTGAKLMMHEADASLLEEGGNSDYRFPQGRGTISEPVKVDRRLKEGDKVEFGGMVFDIPGIKAFAPNITPDPETGIGKWTEAQLAKAIREGVRPDGTIIGPPMPIEFYRDMSDADVAAIAAYVMAQPAVKNAVLPCVSCCSPSPTCCCWTSPPTTWTPNRWIGWSSSSAASRAPWWPSPTTATSWTTPPNGSLNSTADRASPTRATTPTGWTPRNVAWSRSRKPKTPAPRP